MAERPTSARTPRRAAPSGPAAVDARDVEERLLQAALKLFGKRGYAAVSVREVARAAGVTTPNVYYYFGSKRGLYLRLLHNLLERRATAMSVALAEKGDPIARLRRVLEAYVWFDRDNPVEREAQLFLLREMYGLGSDMFSDLVTEHDASNRRAVRQVLEEGVQLGLFRPVRLEHTAIAILGVMQTFIRRAALGARVRPSDAITQVMDVIVEGLRDRSRPEPAVTVTSVTIDGGRRRRAELAGEER